MIRKLAYGAGAIGASLFAATTAFAQEATEAATAAASTAAAAATTAAATATSTLIAAPTDTAAMVNKGDTSWMLISSALVLMMSIPGLALF